MAFWVVEFYAWSTIWNLFDLMRPQQPPSERVPYIREKLDFWWSIQQKITSIGYFGVSDDQNIRNRKFFLKKLGSRGCWGQLGCRGRCGQWGCRVIDIQIHPCSWTTVFQSISFFYRKWDHYSYFQLNNENLFMRIRQCNMWLLFFRANGDWFVTCWRKLKV